MSLRCLVGLLLVSLGSSTPLLADCGPVPQWIWSSELPLAGEQVELHRTFAVRRGLARAELSGLADDQLVVLIDDRSVLTATQWSRWTTVDVEGLTEGEHRMVCRASNLNGYAGCAVRLRLKYEDGSVEVVTTDPTWNAATGPAVSHGLVGSSPWGDPVGEAGDYYQWKDALESKPAEPAASIRVLPGFEVELVRSAQPGESSWISLTFDPQGRILLGCEGRDKRHGLLRLTLPKSPQEAVRVEPVEETLREPRGLAFGPDGSLYVNANNAHTLVRAEDAASQGRFDRVTPLRKSPGGVGHGRNNLTFGPDGALYSIHGNDVRLPEDFRAAESRVIHQENDRLLACRWDRFLFDYAAKLPAGHLIRTTDPATSWELMAGGFRNPYGIDFNPDGELFTFDADNEGDLGTPWYRPTRVNHVVSGGDYGWRQGTAMRPTWYPDVLPATLEIGKTSPTDIKFGTRSGFPQRLKESLFILDWSYGKIHAIRFEPRGASYVATAETFLEGRPLNVTDLEFGPDGALYFTTGGRATQSGLYRVRYTGSLTVDKTDRVSADPTATEARRVRRQLEAFHARVDAGAIPAAWPHLASRDRWLRHAARIAIEFQPVETWRERALAETDPMGSATALLALSRSEAPEGLPRVLERWTELPLVTWPIEEQVIALRAAQVALHRTGKPGDELRRTLTRVVEDLFPSRNWSVNQLAAELLVALESPRLVPKAVTLLKESRLQEETMLWFFLLRNVRVGWTLDDRRTYLAALQSSDAFQGGRELPVGLFGITGEFRESLTAEERTALASELAATSVETSPAALQSTRPFVREWKLAELVDQVAPRAEQADIERGHTLYREALCVRCHRYGGEGKPIGPDLHAVSRRMSRRDLLETILVPSKVVDEKYRDTTFVLTTGKVVAGRIVGGDDRSLLVAPNATSPFDTVTIALDEIESRQPSPVSPMPVGLLNTLTEEEIRCLLAYLESDQAEFRR
ncbi:c-type cytochrome [Planctomyces sp. SH-PL14]|uniref:c-type cytochrome n=1 Tax=Planctomyces sp. SH-PL14 TaxID=1632864 RepID=UPI00078B3479|nr:c-type cytochrome [Planctomyces sp. SH-PL14]AMV19947.1 Cytochrome c [Planctomyces sp. SH-PL14]